MNVGVPVMLSSMQRDFNRKVTGPVKVGVSVGFVSTIHQQDISGLIVFVCLREPGRALGNLFMGEGRKRTIEIEVTVQKLCHQQRVNA
jgi:hypothetical protein